MWIYTNYGMASVVSDETYPGTAMIRCRVRRHADNLAKRLNDVAGGPKYDVDETPEWDYAYRIRAVAKPHLAAVLAADLDTMTYPDFKGSCSPDDGHAYLEVWEATRDALGDLDEREMVEPHVGYRG